MKFLTVKLFCLFYIFTTASVAYSQIGNSKHVGPEAIADNGMWEPVLKNTTPRPPTASQQQIARILSIASQMEYVADTMAVKESGLVYVTNLSDLDYLTSFTVTNPSDDYKAATAEFIAKHVGTYISSRADIPALMKLTQRIQTVAQAMACKNAGLKVINSVAAFLRILPFSVEEPSDTYRAEVSTFVAQNISRFVGPRTTIASIIAVEKYTTLVVDAMAVKNAGLAAVRNKQGVLDLAKFAFESPTAAYQYAVREFIRENINRFPL
jgi:hypothetical protein